MAQKSSETHRRWLESLATSVPRYGGKLWRRLPWLGRPVFGSEALGIVILPLTILWVLCVLLAESGPATGRAAVELFALTLAVMLPSVLLLCRGTYSIFLWKRRDNAGRPGDMLGPAAMALVAFAWLSVSLLLASEPAAEFLTSALWIWYTLGVTVTWLVILVWAAYDACRERDLRRAKTFFGYLLPLGVVAAVLIPVVSYDVPLRIRFELSEGALYEVANSEMPSQNGRVGLYHVQGIYSDAGCTLLETQSFFSETGFAYCTGDLPTATVVDMDHFTGNWWVYVADDWD